MQGSKSALQAVLQLLLGCAVSCSGSKHLHELQPSWAECCQVIDLAEMTRLSMLNLALGCACLIARCDQEMICCQPDRLAQGRCGLLLTGQRSVRPLPSTRCSMGVPKAEPPSFVPGVTGDVITCGTEM